MTSPADRQPECATSDLEQTLVPSPPATADLSPTLLPSRPTHEQLHEPLTPTAPGHPAENQTLQPNAGAGPAPAIDAAVPGVPAIPGYHILSELGRGGMGVVYKAHALRLNRVVALKMIRAGSCADVEERLRFLQEAEAVAKLQHSGIVQIYDSGQHDGLPYFSLEFLEGGSLTQKLAGKPQQPREAAQLVLRLAEAMHHAHKRNIVHRDLKPANVLLTADGQPKITDFGLAKQIEGGSGLTQTNAIMGTPSYMAPEQASGESKGAGPAADIYALGAILYECLTGRPPYQAPTPVETLTLVLAADTVPPRQLQPKVPRDLETICLKCLQKEPNRRYPTAQELAEDLGRFLNDESIKARPISWWERSVKWAKRRPTVTALLCLSLLAVAGLAVGVWSYNERLKAERATSLVQALTQADTQNVPHIIADLDAYRPWADPLLRQAVAEASADSRQKLHASLALLPVDHAQLDYLAGYLRRARPEEIGILRNALAAHYPRIGEQLWAVVEDDRADAGERLRVACVLAQCEPDDPRWAQVSPAVAARLVAENPLVVGRWTEALRPVGSVLVRPLTGVFRDAGRSESERSLAANLLADYAVNRPEILTDLLLHAGPTLFPIFLTPLQAHREIAAARLRAELALKPLPAASEADRDELAQRQVQAAVALLHLNEPETVWPLFRHSQDPRRRTYLIHRLAPLRTDPSLLVQRLGVETNVSARRGLLLSLGEFPAARIPEAERQLLTARLEASYRDDPDPGIHSAVDWLLRRWGGAARVQAIEATLPAKTQVKGRRWYVNGQGQTLAVVPAPEDFLMGSPNSDPDRFESEVLHRKHIPRSFAIATKEVTLEQFLRFKPGHTYSKKYSPSPDTPATNILWYEAAQYCRWLSEKEGIPEDQMCYPPVAEIKKGMVLPRNYLSRTGYRLPTEAEWEYACRAGAVTRRFYGDADELLEHYAWYASNSRDRVWPVGLKKPNDLGLFDVYGNVWECCQDAWSGEPYRPAPEGQASEDREPDPEPADRERHRHVRGGAFSHPSSTARSANRQAYLPSVRNNPVGLRVVQTVR